MPSTSPEPSHPPRRTTRFGAALARAYWILLGNLLVGLTAVRIATGPDGLTARDALYWAGVAALVLVRYVDVDRLGGTTSDGDDATLADWRRYSIGVLGVSALSWLVVHGVARFLRS